MDARTRGKQCGALMQKRRQIEVNEHYLCCIAVAYTQECVQVRDEKVRGMWGGDIEGAEGRSTR